MTNPLLELSALPNHAPPFDKIEEQHYLPAIETAIEQARANIDAIRDNEEEPTFDNTIVALETASELLGTVTSVFYNQLSANGTDGLHELAEKIGPVSSNFSNDIMHDAKLFARVKAVHDIQETLNLNAEQQMLLDDTYIGFVRGGALLDAEKKQRLREISERMSVLSPVYMNNNKKSAEQFEMVIENEDDLAGLPESAVEGAKHAAEEKGYDGKWLFTLDMPSYIPFIQYADTRELREKIWRAYNSQSFGDDYDNSEAVLEIVTLRHERAQLLGYTTHAHYVLERRMAERPETVMDFLAQLKRAYKPAAEEDLRQLQLFAEKQGGPEPLQPWDVAYYAEKQKQTLFDFSSEDFRPYFPLQQVIDGVFEHFGKLFNLQFKPSDAYPVWHEDVKVFDVHDKTDSTFLGTLYADFHPRSGKNNGAWKTSYRDQGLFHGKLERPVIAIVCNFSKPTKDKPSLLTHGEVETLLHEMGHAMHAMVSKATYRSLSGTNVLWDFVELPSQIQENWGYTRETLDLFAAHYKTGEKIPGALIDKLNKAKNYMVGWGGLRQVGLATLDMAWHSQDPAGITDVAKFEDDATAGTSLFPRLAGPISTHFGHIFAGGYSAGYYSYKWAEVLDADAFELFLERGLYDRPTAEAFKNEVLAKGGSEHPTVLYRRFRGRDADPDALLRREGLMDAA
ncbi:MAG: M3 family metallopeptidase [Rhodospirillales bacterium]|nr:M3 family metallopeptidase [Rhodospirillales bacterium]MCB9994932.1 M3 family metallopeptidase [Rhodospirillales bacterium]